MPTQPRQAGLLLHPTSLPGGHGVGDLGGEATRFLDWLHHAGVSLWQVLPLGPVGVDGSPYSAWSALAGNPLLIDLHDLAAAGLLPPSAVTAGPPPSRVAGGGVDYRAALAFKLPLVRQAAEALVRALDHPWQAEFAAFQRDSPWAEEAALFSALRAVYSPEVAPGPTAAASTPWWRWPAPLRQREPAALAAARRRYAEAIQVGVAVEFLFDRQWRDLRRRAADRGVQLFGDIPIYVGGDSVDTWAGQGRFKLDRQGLPLEVAGVPPDAFSAVGQLWGNPLYDWQAHAAEGFAWWIARLRRALAQCDLVRIDHFRAFAAYWAIPADADDARAGQWRPGPGQALFDALAEALTPTQATALAGDDSTNTTRLPVVAEDLGTIDADVRALMASAGLPGMEVLQFGFDGDPHNGYLPHNHRRRAVAYLGTHDNDTALGWWRGADEQTRHRVRTYFGVDGHDIVWTLIRATLASVAERAVLTAQDVLALGGEARMNTPGVAAGNWSWRLPPDALQPWHADRLRDLVGLYGRAPGSASRSVS